jgi:hypothetical protein
MFRNPDEEYDHEKYDDWPEDIEDPYKYLYGISQADACMQAKLGSSFGQRRHPRVRLRKGTRQRPGWKWLAGPFRTKKKAFRVARELRDDPWRHGMKEGVTTPLIVVPVPGLGGRQTQFEVVTREDDVESNPTHHLYWEGGPDEGRGFEWKVEKLTGHDWKRVANKERSDIGLRPSVLGLAIGRDVLIHWSRLMSHEDLEVAAMELGFNLSKPPLRLIFDWRSGEHDAAARDVRIHRHHDQNDWREGYMTIQEANEDEDTIDRVYMAAEVMFDAGLTDLMTSWLWMQMDAGGPQYESVDWMTR